MYNIYDIFENYKFERVVGHDFDKIQEYIENFSIYNKYVVMEGYLDDLIDFEPVTEGFKEACDKVIEFIKGLAKKMREWFDKVLDIFRKKDKDYVKKSDVEVKAIGEGEGDSVDKIKKMADEQAKKTAELVANHNLKKKAIDLPKFDTTLDLLKNTHIDVNVPPLSPGPKKLCEETWKVIHDADMVLFMNFGGNEGWSKPVEEISKEFHAKIKAGGYVGTDANKTNDRSLEKNMKEETKTVKVSAIAEEILRTLDEKYEVEKELNKMKANNESRMNQYIKLLDQAGKLNKMDQTSINFLTKMVRDASSLTSSRIRNVITRIGRNYNICKAIVERAKANYRQAMAGARKL